MNWWNIFVLFLCILECCCPRRFFNLLQASLHFSKQHTPSFVALVISVKSSCLIFIPRLSFYIRKYLRISNFLVICHIMLLVYLLSEALSGFVWHRHIWNVLNTTYCLELFSHAQQCFGLSQSDSRCLCLISGKYNFGFGSRCCPVAGQGGGGGTWQGSCLIWRTVSAPQHDTYAQTHPMSPSLDGVWFPSMLLQPLRAGEHHTWWRTPRVTSATTGARCHRNINIISLGIQNISNEGVEESLLSYKQMRI